MRFTNRNRYGWDRSEVGGHGEDVGKIYVIWIGFGAQLECHGRRGWREQYVDAAVEHALNILRDQIANALGARVVLIVVARRQNVSAEHNAPFYFGAKPYRPRTIENLAERFRVVAAQPVTHAV